jgi:hypothetical protein
MRILESLFGEHRASSAAQQFFTNSFPGNCFTNRFISKLNNATETAELGRPHLRMTSSVVSSLWSRTPNTFCSFSERSSAGSTPVSFADGGRLLAGKRYSNSLKISSTPSHSFAPFLINSWQPLLRGESIVDFVYHKMVNWVIRNVKNRRENCLQLSTLVNSLSRSHRQGQPNSANQLCKSMDEGFWCAAGLRLVE